MLPLVNPRQSMIRSIDLHPHATSIYHVYRSIPYTRPMVFMSVLSDIYCKVKSFLKVCPVAKIKLLLTQFLLMLLFKIKLLLTQFLLLIPVVLLTCPCCSSMTSTAPCHRFSAMVGEIICFLPRTV